MNRVEELIERLCPEGVKTYSIDELCTISRGRVISKTYVNENKGIFPVYSSQTENSGELGCISSYDYDGEYLTWTTDGANAGTVFYRYGKFSITNVCGLLKVKNALVSTKYLYYTLSVEAQKYVNRGMGNPKLMSNTMARISVFVPPLEVQNEIVNILDNFSKLEAELEAELEARKQQYEYYCLSIIQSIKTAQQIKVKDLGEWSGGKTPSTANQNFWENGCIPWVSSKDMKSATLLKTENMITEDAVKNTSIKIYPKNTIAVVVRSGILKRTLPIAYIPFETTVNQDIKILVPKSTVHPRYAYNVLYAYSKEILAKAKKRGGTVDSLDVSKFMNFEIPLPSLEEQTRIVSILDRFDKLCNDLTEGLPAEIEARRKQYEYYRDLLLTFKPKEKECSA